MLVFRIEQDPDSNANIILVKTEIKSFKYIIGVDGLKKPNNWI